jgi:hypothetical protein
MIKTTMEDDMSALTNNSPLPFDLDYMGKRLTTVGDASAFILSLSEEEREQHHWRVAHMAISCALAEPAYLDTATLTLRTALTLHEIVQPWLLDVH